MRVGVRHVRDARQQRSKTPPLCRLAGCQRQRAQRPAMKTTQKGDEPVPPRVVARQLQRRLHRLGAGVSEIDPLGRFAGRDLGQLRGQLSQ